VERAVAKHPELTVLALRAAPKAGDIVVLGSTFGRHGKKADADDLKVIESGVADIGIFSGGKRFGATLPLRDHAAKVIGSVAVGYAYQQGADPKALAAKAQRLRDELQKEIPSAEKLNELDP